MLFVGRLSKDTRTRDLEDVFESYGRMTRCDIKYGAEMAYAFVDYEDRRDAEDAMKYENGRDIRGSSIIVEWAKGSPRRGGGGGGGGGGRTDYDGVKLVNGYDECYKCHRVGHWARDCPDDRNYGFRRSRGERRRSRSYSPRRRSRSHSPRRRSRSPGRRRRSRSRSRGRRHYSRSYSRSNSPSDNRKHRRDSRSPRRDSRSRSRSGSRSN